MAGFCPQCGTPHEEDAKFCQRCGRSLSGTEPQSFTEKSGPAPAAPSAPSPPTPPSTEQGSRRALIAAGVILIVAVVVAVVLVSAGLI